MTHPRRARTGEPGARATMVGTMPFPSASTRPLPGTARRTVLGVGLAAFLVLAGCSVDTQAPGAESAEPVASGGTTAVAPTPALRSMTATPVPPLATDAPHATGATPKPTSAVKLQSVSVTVTYAAWDTARRVVLAGAYVTGAVESGGRCTLVLTAKGQTVAASSAGSADASTTSCAEMSATVPSGAWTAQVTYLSAAATGTSATMTVTVP